jgi:hypothetical protein
MPIGKPPNGRQPNIDLSTSMKAKYFGTEEKSASRSHGPD